MNEENEENENRISSEANSELQGRDAGVSRMSVGTNIARCLLHRERVPHTRRTLRGIPDRVITLLVSLPVQDLQSEVSSRSEFRMIQQITEQMSAYYSQPLSRLGKCDSNVRRENYMKSKAQKYLNILSVLHYVNAGYQILTFLFIFRYILAGGLGFIATLGNPERAVYPSESFSSWGEVVLVVTLLIIWWGLITCLILTGRRLKTHKSHIFCMIVAGVECISFPFGTILGIFTLITLNQVSVKNIFANK